MGPHRIVLIQGHPDAQAPHLCHALAQAYADGATAAGHEVRQIDVATIDFALLRSQHEWELGLLPAVLKPAQADIGWAQHIVLFFPLWLGDMPALLKGFLEQVARPGFAFNTEGGNTFGRKGLTGRSARVVVTCVRWGPRRRRAPPPHCNGRQPNDRAAARAPMRWLIAKNSATVSSMICCAVLMESMSPAVCPASAGAASMSPSKYTRWMPAKLSAGIRPASWMAWVRCDLSARMQGLALVFSIQVPVTPASTMAFL